MARNRRKRMSRAHTKRPGSVILGGKTKDITGGATATRYAITTGSRGSNSQVWAPETEAQFEPDGVYAITARDEVGLTDFLDGVGLDASPLGFDPVSAALLVVCQGQHANADYCLYGYSLDGGAELFGLQGQLTPRITGNGVGMLVYNFPIQQLLDTTGMTDWGDILANVTVGVQLNQFTAHKVGIDAFGVVLMS